MKANHETQSPKNQMLLKDKVEIEEKQRLFFFKIT
jgi:hypothetical protein